MLIVYIDFVSDCCRGTLPVTIPDVVYTVFTSLDPDSVVGPGPRPEADNEPESANIIGQIPGGYIEERIDM